MPNRVIFYPLVESDGKLPAKAQNGEAYHNASGVLFMKLADGSVVNCVEAALAQFGSAVGEGQTLDFGASGEAKVGYTADDKTLSFANTANSGIVSLSSRNAAGDIAKVIESTGDGSTSVYHPVTNKEVFRTSASGIQIYGGDGYLSTAISNTATVLESDKPMTIQSAGAIQFISDHGNANNALTFTNSGDLRISGNIVAFFSDERLKTNFAPIGAALHKVSQLEGVFYSPNAKAVELGFDSLDTQLVGLRAQQVLNVLPEAVTDIGIESGEGEGDMYLTVQYEKLVPLLIEAIKELNTKLDKVSA